MVEQIGGASMVGEERDYYPPPSFSGRWINLRAPNRSDYPQVYAWRNDPRSLYLWHYNRRLLPYEEFVAEFERGLANTVTLLIEDVTSRQLIGFVQSYNANSFEGWTYLLLYVAPDHRLRGTATEAGFIFLDYLFKSFPLRKVYAEIFAFNELSLKTALTAGFQEEGRLRDHVWYDDRYWDLIQLGLSRETWEDERQRLRVLDGIQAVAQGIFPNSDTLEEEA